MVEGGQTELQGTLPFVNPTVSSEGQTGRQEIYFELRCSLTLVSLFG